MKASDQYLRFVRWEEADALYVGYCPDLFVSGACHSESESEAYGRLCALVDEEIADLLAAGRPLPPAATQPVRQAEMAA